MASLLHLPADDSVLLVVTHSNIKSFSPEIRFSLQMSVEAVKEKLWRKCGTAVESMLLELHDDAGSKIADLSDNLRPLGFYSPQDRFVSSPLLARYVYRLHIIDLDPSSVTSGGWLEDTSLVEKYTISEEAYSKLDSNFRKFKEKMISQNPTHDKK
ncbi:Tubulin-folding cofactor B, partial [Ananas comosus]